jgi:hypothetical protein
MEVVMVKQRMIAPGNLIFKSGAGGEDPSRSRELAPIASGDIVFMHADKEWMRVKDGGVVIIDGAVVATAGEAYKRFMAWLTEATVAFEGASEYKATDVVVIAQAGGRLS